VETKELKMVEVSASEYGIEEVKAQQIKAVFTPMLDKMAELEVEYNEVIKLEVSKESCKVAGELRKKYVKVRTSTAKLHKVQKAFYLAGGRFIDGLKNAQKFACEGIEENLSNFEKHYDKIEAEKLLVIKEERETLLRNHGAEVIPTNLDTLDDAMWETYLTGVKAAETARKEVEAVRIKAEEDAKIERERVEKEAAEKRQKEEAERLKREAETKAENEKLKRDAEIAEKKRIKDEADRKAEEEKAAKARQKIEDERIAKEAKERKEAEEKEADRLEAERVKEEDRLKKERAESDRVEAEKARAHRIADAKIKAEREAKEKLEAELKAKEDAEIAAEEKRLADIEEQERVTREKVEVELNKGDAAKVTDLIFDLKFLKTKYSFKSAKNKKRYLQVGELLDKVINHIQK